MPASPTLKELKCFVSVYRAGRLTAAANRMALTHSAVSVLLRQLEDKLQVSLFERTTRSVRPTEAAQELIGRAERLLLECEEFADRARALGRSRAAVIRVAVTPIVAQTLLPKALARFSQSGADTQVLVDDCAPGDFFGLVQGGRVDFGIGAPGPVPADLEVRPLSRDDLAVCGTRLGGSAHAVTWKGLDGCSVITLRQGYGLRSAIESTAQEAGVTLHFRHEVTLLSTAFALAAQGLGVVILPSALARLADKPALDVKRITRPVTPRYMYLVTRKGTRLTDAGEKFCQAAEQALSGR